MSSGSERGVVAAVLAGAGILGGAVLTAVAGVTAGFIPLLVQYADHPDYTNPWTLLPAIVAIGVIMRSLSGGVAGVLSAIAFDLIRTRDRWIRMVALATGPVLASVLVWVLWLRHDPSVLTGLVLSVLAVLGWLVLVLVAYGVVWHDGGEG